MNKIIIRIIKIPDRSKYCFCIKKVVLLTIVKSQINTIVFLHFQFQNITCQILGEYLRQNVTQYVMNCQNISGKTFPISTQ